MTDTSNSTKGFGRFALKSETIDAATSEIQDRLTLIYCLIQPGKTPDDFMENIVKPLFASAPENPAEINFSVYMKHNEVTFRLYARRIVSCLAYCVEGMTAEEAGHSSKAWNLMANALYHLGDLEGLLAVEPLVTGIITKRASHASSTKNDKYIPLRELAVKLVTDTSYTTKNKAAIAIKGQILAESERLGVGLMESGAVKTISNWISGCEFGEKK